MAAIQFENVTKTFGDIKALDNVSFEIPDNSFFCFFGPPLSGKSTILKIILGLETPDSGRVLFDGIPVTNISPAERNVAMVFQNLALFPHMTARENIRFPLEERGVDADTISNRVDDVSEKLHMAHILHKPPYQLSGGERQRVAIARALVRDPVAFLMDDPISALDARLREETRIELKRIQQELKKTLVYVTHDQEEAMSVSDQIAILDNGTIQQIGAPHDVYDKPDNFYVANMLGAPAINVVPADEGINDIFLKGMPLIKGASSIGIRPESLQLNSEAGNGRISSVEPMGATTIVTVAANGQNWKAALRGQPVLNVGDAVSFSVDPDQIIFFDKAGAAIKVA